MKVETYGLHCTTIKESSAVKAQIFIRGKKHTLIQITKRLTKTLCLRLKKILMRKNTKMKKKKKMKGKVRDYKRKRKSKKF